MSSQQPNRSPAGPPRPGTGAPPSGGGGGGVAFDPLKLLQKYKFVLVGAVIVGAFIGVGSHFLFLKLAPGYKAVVLFECSPVDTEIQMLSSATIDEDEMGRFMGTQVERIKGDIVIQAVLNDARLQNEAPGWYKKYSKRGALDVVDAFEELDKIIKANAIPNTYLIQLSVQVGDANDAAGLARIIKENYIRGLSLITNSDYTERKEAIRRAVTEVDDSLDELNKRKKRLIVESGSEASTVENSAQADQLRMVNGMILTNEAQIEAVRVTINNYEAQLQRTSGIEFDALLEAQVDTLPIIQGLKQQITSLQIQMQTLQAGGIQPEHRSYQLVLLNIEANERELETTRDVLLLETFEATLESNRRALSQYQSQIVEFLTQKEELEDELNRLTQTIEDISDITRQIENALSLKADHKADLAQLSMSSRLDNASRIHIYQNESVPDRPSFPVLIIMLPAGVFLITALTVGGIVVFEMLDQRVKSAADIALIPRARILGIIPDADEDPAAHTSIETLFMDSPNSVLAEHYRQLRTKITKSMDAHGHTTLLVAGAMPGSGATSVATNLAQACVAAGKKTLLLDTNFRRPKIHTAFGLLDSPGLAETLAG
ncbi:MAG: hypothetical protein JKX70_11455, partial [Phycisphaerales bacterium]|nr:hypothetical protein [Phycisphaerales bacterium]